VANCAVILVKPSCIISRTRLNIIYKIDNHVQQGAQELSELSKFHAPPAFEVPVRGDLVGIMYITMLMFLSEKYDDLAAGGKQF